MLRRQRLPLHILYESYYVNMDSLSFEHVNWQNLHSGMSMGMVRWTCMKACKKTNPDDLARSLSLGHRAESVPFASKLEQELFTLPTS